MKCEACGTIEAHRVELGNARKRISELESQLAALQKYSNRLEVENRDATHDLEILRRYWNEIGTQLRVK